MCTRESVCGWAMHLNLTAVGTFWIKLGDGPNQFPNPNPNTACSPNLRSLKAGLHIHVLYGTSISTRRSVCEPGRDKHKRACAVQVHTYFKFLCLHYAYACIIPVNQPQELLSSSVQLDSLLVKMDTYQIFLMCLWSFVLLLVWSLFSFFMNI